MKVFARNPEEIFEVDYFNIINNGKICSVEWKEEKDNKRYLNQITFPFDRLVKVEYNPQDITPPVRLPGPGGVVKRY